MVSIEQQLAVEIKMVHANIDAQKRAIKQNAVKGLAVDEAKQQLKQLRTRLGVLEGNLAKCAAQAAQAETTI